MTMKNNQNENTIGVLKAACSLPAFAVTLLVAEVPLLAAPSSPPPSSSQVKFQAQSGSRPISVTGGVAEEAVQGLIDTIEQGKNASLLKFGYFMQSSGVGAGQQRVFAALQREPIGTKRWFLLQSVSGFAAFHGKSANVEAGFIAYNALFTEIGKAQDKDTLFAVARGLNEYLATVLSTFRVNGL